MPWTVVYSKNAIKQYNKLTPVIQDRLDFLTSEIEQLGPVRGNWKNYSKLGNGKHHCHIKSGKPTYVVIWEEVDHTVRLVEVTYAGSHEKAPY